MPPTSAMAGAHCGNSSLAKARMVSSADGARLDPVRGLAQGGGLAVGDDAGDDGVEHRDGRLLGEGLAQAVHDHPRIGRDGIGAVEHDAERRRLDAQAAEGREVLQQLEGAAAELAAASISGIIGDGARSQARMAIFQQHAARALGVDQDQVVMRAEALEQVMQAQATIGGMQQQGGQLTLRVVGEDQVEIGYGAARDDPLAACLVEGDQLVDAAGAS